MPISTFNGLNIALSALQAEQASLDTTSHNIANASTVGYSRQVSSLEAKPGLGALSVWGMIIPGQTGQGVQVADVTRIRDQFNDNNLRANYATQGEADVRQATWQNIETALPEPGDNGLQASMSNFWTAMQNVSTNPEDAGSRQALAQSVQALGQSFQNASNTLTQQRNDVDTQANSMVDTINADASSIAKLNTSISDLESVGQNPNDLLDQRDNIIDQLSALGNTTVTPGTNGVVTVTLGGALIVDPSTSTGLPATPVTRATFNTNYGSTTPQPTVAAGLTGGQLKGLLDAYSTTLNPGVPGSIPAKLDQLAISIHDAVNTQNEAGFDLNGTAGGPLFAGTTITSASQLAVDPGVIADPSKIAASSTAAGAPGDSTNMIAMIALRANGSPAGSTLGGKTFDDFYSGMVSSMGLSAQTATTDSTNSATVVNTLSTARSQVSGVSLDEEMTNLVKFQHAYAAAGRAMSTMNEMLDTLVNMVQ
jgi:flagellar hook-associated protein 1 FlgK